MWCARHAAANPREFKIDMLPGLALWSWVSQRPDAAAHKFIELRWEPSIGLTRAASACIRWLESVSTQLAIEAAAPRGWWFKPGEFDGLAFVPLDTAEKISAEAGVMKNCMLGYGPDIFEGYLQFWSVRREGSRVAVLSIERSPTSRVPHVGQLTGPENEDAGQQAWIATAKWIQRQDLTAHLMPARASEQGSIASTLWLETWRPYWQEKQKIPKWLPACFDSNWRWNMNDCGHVFEEEHRRLRRWRRGRRQN